MSIKCVRLRANGRNNSQLCCANKFIKGTTGFGQKKKRLLLAKVRSSCEQNLLLSF